MGYGRLGMGGRVVMGCGRGIASGGGVTCGGGTARGGEPDVGGDCGVRMRQGDGVAMRGAGRVGRGGPIFAPIVPV